MTNPTLPNLGATLPRELLALAPVGGKRRPVKVVEHPTFRAARARLEREAPMTVLRVPVVSLNRAAAAAAARCRTPGATMAHTSCEAA